MARTRGKKREKNALWPRKFHVRYFVARPVPPVRLMAQFTLTIYIGRVTCDRKCRREKGKEQLVKKKGKARGRKMTQGKGKPHTGTRYANATPLIFPLKALRPII